MKITNAMTASAVALAAAFAAPAMAQDYSGDNVNATADDSDIYDIYDSEVTNDLIDASIGSTVDDVNSYNTNDYDTVVSTQVLISANANQAFEELVDMDTYEDYVELSTGANYVSDNAFTAFAGIANLSLNSGVNSHAQSATSIAAQGNINFGDSSGAE
ncbi:MAG: hypothetical protein AAF941_03060 [Pseudomonadota bacterium]